MTRRATTARTHARRTRPVRRASTRLSRVRAGAALVMVLAAAAIYGVSSSPAFGLADLRIEGLRYTDAASLRATLDVRPGSNLFALPIAPLEARVRGLPTVEEAHVSVNLPSTLVVDLVEREPVLAWWVGDRRFLVDADGRLFAELGANPPPEARALRVIEDRRADSGSLRIGARLPEADVDAARRLGSLEPADVGSTAAVLELAVTDEYGFVLATGPDGWTAVFGFYTPTLRTTAIIPGQVRLLRSVLDGREEEIERVILASETDGTFVPRPTPPPGESPQP